MANARMQSWRAILVALMIVAATAAPARAQSNLGNYYQNLYISTHPPVGLAEEPKPDRKPWVLIVLGVGALVYRRRIGAAFRAWQARRPGAASASPGAR